MGAARHPLTWYKIQQKTHFFLWIGGKSWLFLGLCQLFIEKIKLFYNQTKTPFIFFDFKH